MKNEEYERARKKILDEEEEAEAEPELAQEVSLIDEPPNPRLIERLVTGLSEVCKDRKQCGYSKTKVFEPRLTKEQFEHSKWADVELRCPKCDSKCYVSPVLEPMEEALTNKYHLKSMKDTQELYYYDEQNGVYHGGAEWLVRKACVEDNPQITTKDANDIKNRITWVNYTNREDFDPKIEWICCKNLMVNVLTGEVKKHSPDYMTTVQIPHDYLVVKYPCMPRPSKIMGFLYEVMAHEDVETVLDFIAYCLWRGFPFHRWILFNGSGRNGKGTLTRLITRLLGRPNVSSETLHRILENRYAPANLFGKLANMDADLSSKALKQTGILKMLTGGDDIAGEKKYRTAFYFTNYAKLIFSANIAPISPDETDAFFARLIIINFPNQYLGDRANPNLIDELTTKEEMSLFLTMLIRRLPRVLKYGITLHHDSIEENYWRYLQSSDSMRVFLETCIDKTSDEALHPEAYEIKDDVYNAYTKLCAQKRLPKESGWNFSKRLKDSGLKSGQKRTERGKVSVWKNIQLKDWKKVEDESQETLD